MHPRSLLASLFVCLAITGCATKPDQSASLKSAYAPMTAPEHGPLTANEPIKMEPTAWIKPESPNRDGGLFGSRSLGGRTISVGSLTDIHLNDKEVVLTFDDGPMPGKTRRILDILDRFHVKASFMMIGQMAQSHPELAREVLARGHAIGSHTYSHRNLASMSFDMAMNEFARGEKAVSDAVDTPVGFFRFPYLSDSRRLRGALTNRGVVVMDVDIDSKDYFKTSPNAVLNKTLNAIHRRGKGIILMHDIHNRTIAMLPMLLTRLDAEGYHVVSLRYKRSRLPQGSLVASIF